jgi:hypothetical protein
MILKRHLRQTQVPIDKAFLLGGLVRSGDNSYCEALHQALVEAYGASTIWSTGLNYIWKREFVFLLNQSTRDGEAKSSAWAEVFGVSREECLEEMRDGRLDMAFR